MSTSMTVPVTDHLGPDFDRQEHRPAPFTWHPPAGAKRLFDTLLDKGVYHCPWPDCDQTSTGPQGIGRHMTYKHGWRPPAGYKPSHPAKKAAKTVAKRTPHPSDGARKEKVTCPYIANGKPCGRTLRKDYLRHHLRDFHHVPLDRIDAVLNSVLSSQPRQPAPLQELQLLEAPEICMSVLETVSPNGSIPIRAMAAYQTWVDHTRDFLKVFYDRES